MSLSRPFGQYESARLSARGLTESRYGPFFYITYYAVTTKITGGSLGFYLLSILNAASVFGRILPNFVADEVGPFNVIVPCAVVAGALTLGLIGTHSAGGIVAIAALYGFFSGSFVSLPPVFQILASCSTMY